MVVGLVSVASWLGYNAYRAGDLLLEEKEAELQRKNAELSEVRGELASAQEHAGELQVQVTELNQEVTTLQQHIQGAQICLDHVAHMDEVSRLMPVAINDTRLALS